MFSRKYAENVVFNKSKINSREGLFLTILTSQKTVNQPCIEILLNFNILNDINYLKKVQINLNWPSFNQFIMVICWSKIE